MLLFAFLCCFLSHFVYSCSYHHPILHYHNAVKKEKAVIIFLFPIRHVVYFNSCNGGKGVENDMSFQNDKKVNMTVYAYKNW